MRIVAVQAHAAGKVGWGQDHMGAFLDLTTNLGRLPSPEEVTFEPIVTDPEPSLIEVIPIQK